MSSAKKRRDLNRAIEEHKTVKVIAQFATSKHTMLNIAESVLAKENESLRTQMAELTRTNLEQAAQIEKLKKALTYYSTGMWKTETFSYCSMNPLDYETFKYDVPSREPATKALTLSTTPPQALKAFSNVLRNEAIEQAAVASWMHYMDTCKRLKINASEHGEWLCADDIRQLKELP